MKLTTKQISQIANRASWLDPEAKKKSLALGRSKAYKARREAGKNSFTDNHRDTLRIKKYEQYHNYLAIFLIENKVNSLYLLKFTKRLNTPNFYSDDLKLNKAILKFVFDANTEHKSIINYETAHKLIMKGLIIKVQLFPEQTAPLRARERTRKERRLKSIERQTEPKKQELKTKSF